MSTTQDRLRQAARFTRLDADRELLTEAADALDRREAVIRLLEGEVALAVPGVPDDTKRLEFAFSGHETDSNALVLLELRRLKGETPTLDEVRAAIDAAMLASRSQEGKA